MYNTVLFQGYTQLRYIATKLLPPKTTIFYWDPCSSQIFNSVCVGGGQIKILAGCKKKGKKGTAPSLNVVMSMTTKGMNLPGSFFFIFEKFFFWLCSYKSFLLKGQNFSRKNTGFRLMKKSNFHNFTFKNNSNAIKF